jgi:hypothetical protein
LIVIAGGSSSTDIMRTLAAGLRKNGTGDAGGE